MRDTVFGDVIEDEAPEIIEDFREVTAEFDALVSGEHRRLETELSLSKRQLAASLAPEKQPYQIIVTATGPECST